MLREPDLRSGHISNNYNKRLAGSASMNIAP